MITVTYNDVLYQAADLAGRQRDTLAVKEATMLQGFIATGLRDIWQGQFQWPELIPDIIAVTTSSKTFSKLEGLTGEMGDILGVWNNNPQTTTSYLGLRFNEQDDKVRIEDGGGTVYVEYMLPRFDLMTISGTPLAEYLIPDRFRNFLAFYAAYNLKLSDGALSEADALRQRAQETINGEVHRLVDVPRRAVKNRNQYEVRPAAGS